MDLDKSSNTFTRGDAMNSLTILGTCGHDASFRVTNTGLPVMNFSIAFNESKKDQNGQWVNGPPQWWNCTIFGKFAESLNASGRFPRKGQRVVVQGPCRLRDYTDKMGAPKVSHEITVQSLVIVPKA